MPRNRPGHIRAGLPRRHREQNAKPVIDGLSPRVLSEIARLERTRNYLEPGETGWAVRLWKDHVRRSARELWHHYEHGDVHDYCCGNPLQARAVLDTVLRAMSPRGARELRKVIAHLDNQLTRSTHPPQVTGGGP
ncbi:hypothetical protein Snoj_29760 [Streptomyces nojiriensis]|uniref:Uncharacterized protein n=1 Tax=Streptomyces nojiriensis TaxID=66374 RepID=A0ABQ3SLQ0_9ACTN|nr:hypothetical protein JYK04_00403 [Streptomyces nojiriensis]GGS15804.1 hypothetical protein GCM10010205_51940 [Streptomyces nojiriensis]GHI69058.1 hypothetical protein Snoj_29760 [Streptomyces nojiriensis]